MTSIVHVAEGEGHVIDIPEYPGHVIKGRRFQKKKHLAEKVLYQKNVWLKRFPTTKICGSFFTFILFSIREILLRTICAQR